MADIIKFNEKNKTIFTKIESVPNVYETSMAATDAVLATVMSGQITIETGVIEFTGNSESRDEYTFEKDRMAEFSIETPQQVLDVVNPALDITTIPLADLYRACSGAVSIDGAGAVTISNATPELGAVSLNFYKTSIDDAVNAKLYRFYGVRGTLDVSMDIKDVPRDKFSFKGNAYEPVTAPIVVPNYGNQSTAVAPTVSKATLVQTSITPYGENFSAQSTVSGTPTIARTGAIATVTLTGHGLVVGQRVNISGATGVVDGYYYNGDFVIASVPTANTFTYVMNGTPSGAAVGTIVVKKDGYSKSFCFNTLQAPNFFGRELTRYLTGCEEGYDRKAVASDVTVTALETHSPSFNVASITRSTTTATLTTDTPHGLVAGNSITVKGATDALYNITTLVETAPSSTTLTYIMGGTPSASAVAVTPGSMRLTNNSSTTFDPDNNIGNFFAVKIKHGTRAGRYITHSWDKLQLTNVKDAKVASSEGREMSFRNTSKATKVLE
jgi:hypothetical protein